MAERKQLFEELLDKFRRRNISNESPPRNRELLTTKCEVKKKEESRKEDIGSETSTDPTSLQNKQITFPGKRNIPQDVGDNPGNLRVSPPLSFPVKKCVYPYVKSSQYKPLSTPEPNVSYFENIGRPLAKSGTLDADEDDTVHVLSARRNEQERKAPNQVLKQTSSASSTDASTEYRIYIFAKYSFQFATDDTIADFQIRSNDGVFENIILQIETNNQTKKYAIHCVASTTELSPNSLSQPDGEFSLQQLFDSYHKLPKEFTDYTLVLLTSEAFINEHQEVRINAGGQIIRAKIVKSQASSLLQKCCYHCEIETQSSNRSSSEIIFQYLAYKEFFNKFVIWCEYPNLKTLKIRLDEEMKEKCACDKIAEKYIKFVTKSIVQERMVEGLTKSTILRVLVMHLVDEILHPLVFGSVNNKAILLQEVISQFNVTVFDENLVENVTALWGNIDEELQNTETIQLLNDQHHICSDITKMDNTEKTKLLWTMDKCPLILKDHMRCKTVINLFKNGKFVVLGRGINVPSECSVFRKLSDFDMDSELCKQLISSFEYSFAGENVPLSFFPGPQCDYQDIVTPSHLIQMVYEPYTIKSKTEDLPSPYIPPRVSRNFIDYRYLETVNHETLVLISNVTNRKKIENSAKQACQYSLNQKNPKFNLWIVEKECSQEDFEQLCRVNKTKKRYHHFCERDGRLEWLKTEGDIDLGPFCIEGNFAEESSLSNFDSNVILIVDEAGKGKSVLLKRLANVLSHFTVYFSSSEIASLCQKTLTRDGLQTFIATTKFPTMTEFDNLLLKILLERNKVVFLWDGLDEISMQYFEIVTNFLVDFKDSVHFITSRPHLKTQLETKFSSLSRSLAQFSREEMEMYIQKHLQVAFPENSENKIKKLNEDLSHLQLDNFLKIPIHLFMLTEVFIKNENVFDELVSVADLYKHFVDEKLKQLDSIDYGFRKEQIEIYQKAALISIIDKDILTKLEIKFDNFTDNFGIFTWVNGKPQFFHHSYAEYFVATYFVKHRARFPDFLRLLFEESYTNVRFFFDVILAEKSVPHLAVLYKNIDVLKQQSNLKIKDAGGRNVLQVACSWGQRYPELKVITAANKYIIDEDCDFVVKEDVKYKQILELLLSMIAADEEDEVFNMDALGYACRTKSVYAILCITQKTWPTYLQTLDYKLLVNYLYYVIRFGFSSIITSTEHNHVIEMRNGNTLLHVAAENSQLQCVQILLNQPKYLKCINQRGKNGETPLHVAARAGDYKITQLLINSGADINAMNDQNQTPIFCAAANNRCHVVTRLITLGANASLQDMFGRTPLSYSCEYGFTGVVEVFLSKTDFSGVDKNGWSPLFYAAMNGREDVVEMLLQSQVAVSITDKFGKSPLGVACEYGHAKVAELLIEAGADINSAGGAVGWTPIFYAAQNGHQEVIQILIINGAKVDVVDKAGNRPSVYIKEPAIKRLLSVN